MYRAAGVPSLWICSGGPRNLLALTMADAATAGPHGSALWLHDRSRRPTPYLIRGRPFWDHPWLCGPHGPSAPGSFGPGALPPSRTGGSSGRKGWMPCGGTPGVGTDACSAPPPAAAPHGPSGTGSPALGAAAGGVGPRAWAL